MFLDAANELFTRAKLRVYGTTNNKQFSKADWAKKENIKALIKQKRGRHSCIIFIIFSVFLINQENRNGSKSDRRKS